MSELTVNQELLLNVPDSFHVMSETERQNVNVMGEGEWIGLSDPDQHIIMTVGWKEIPAFSAFLLSSKSLAQNMEKQLGTPMKPYGYDLIGFQSRQIADMPAEGFQYRYTVGDIGMTGYSCVLKHSRTVYYFHLYARTANESDSIRQFESILDRAHFGK